MTGEEPGSARRDRTALRRGTPVARRRGSAVVSVVGSVIWEVVGELVFLGLVGLVSWLVYEELRWPFIAAVFLGVNAVLAVIAVIVWGRRRRSRGGGRGGGRSRKGRAGADTVRDRTGR